MTAHPLDAFGPRSWARPEVTSFNRLPMSTLLRDDVLRLDGDWSFTLRLSPEAVLAEDLIGPLDDWRDIEVPGCWTMQDVGDAPRYTNIAMPFDGPPPRVPDENPTGVYRKTVTVPESWAGRRIVLHVAGAETVLYIHIDGQPIAMGKDSRLPHEVDLTDAAVPGESFDLALSVVRWSDATYLEDQDHWFHAGLHRSVFLYSTPRTRVADVHATADYDPDTGDGRLHATVALDSCDDPPSGWRVRASVAGHEVEVDAPFRPGNDDAVSWMLFGGPNAIVELSVPKVAAWTAETPNLHRLTITLLDDAGVVRDEVSLDVGFRRVEVRGHELLVNGRAVLIKGVNRHDHDPVRGKAVTRDEIERELVLMKQHGINAIRTSHYPNDTAVADLCDRLGLYLVAEANLETHAHLRSLTKDPVWGPAILERITRLALRDKNHPSIIVWSLGNESGSAPILSAAADWLRRWDPSRPVQYEGVIGDAIFTGLVGGVFADLPEVLRRPTSQSDIVAPMYPSVEELVAWATNGTPDRPLIMCEYSFSLGNSSGGLARYWEAIRRHPGLQGGFVWVWRDQGLVRRLGDGTERLAYGGDFDDGLPHDGLFHICGITDPHLVPHPALAELAAVIAPVRIADVDAARGVVSVTNEHDFVDLSWLTPSWEMAVDGMTVAGAAVEPLALAAGASETVVLGLPDLELGPGERATLTVRFATSEPCAWAPAGQVVAAQQFVIGERPGETSAPGATPRVRRRLEELRPAVALWRAPIDNETVNLAGVPIADTWRRLGLPDDHGLSMTTTTTDADAGLLVEHHVEVPDRFADLPRVGVRLTLGDGVASVEWLGDGPHEGYGDRRTSTRFGRWVTPVDEWPTRYVHPQASGNRTGVRWLRFLDPDGEPVLVIDQLGGLDVTVSRWTDEQVAAAAHRDELPPSNDCYVWIDARHRGVGTGSLGPDVAPEHRVGAGHYRWSYRVR